MYKIIKEGFTPDGVKLVLLDWGEGRGLAIHAYPIARQCSLNRWIVAGELFLLAIAENQWRNYPAEQVRTDFEDLKTGAKQLADLREYFWNGKKDAYLLGLD